MGVGTHPQHPGRQSETASAACAWKIPAPPAQPQGNPRTDPHPLAPQAALPARQAARSAKVLPFHHNGIRRERPPMDAPTRIRISTNCELE